jgi:hypothetical protein
VTIEKLKGKNLVSPRPARSSSSQKDSNFIAGNKVSYIYTTGPAFISAVKKTLTLNYIGEDREPEFKEVPFSVSAYSQNMLINLI